MVVIGATTALEVVGEQFTELTIGSKSLECGHEVKRLLQVITGGYNEYLWRPLAIIQFLKYKKHCL